MKSATATKDTTPSLEKAFDQQYKAALKVLKGDTPRKQAMLTELLATVAKFSTQLTPAESTQNASEGNALATSTDEKPIWLASKEEIEAWFKKLWNAKTVTIISGLDADAPTISSPKELDPTLVNVHKSGETWLYVEEKQRRACEEHGIRLGLREALLSHAKWQEIHEEWYPYWAYFSEAVVEVDGFRYLVCLDPRAYGCRLSASWLGYGSFGNGRFARPRES